MSTIKSNAIASAGVTPSVNDRIIALTNELNDLLQNEKYSSGLIIVSFKNGNEVALMKKIIGSKYALGASLAYLMNNDFK